MIVFLYMFAQREYDLYFYVKRNCLLFFCQREAVFRIFRDAWKDWELTKMIDIKRQQYSCMLIIEMKFLTANVFI